MNISLTRELESRIKQKVESGLYNNASEVVREALRFMETHEAWIYEIKLAQLRAQLQTGIDQLDTQTGQTIETPQSLDQFFRSIKE